MCDDKIVAKAQKLYESGLSRRSIAEKIGKPDATVRAWIDKYGWVKSALRPKIAQKEEESILKVAERIGASKEHVIRKAYELSNAMNAAVPAGNGFSQIPVNEGQNEFMGIQIGEDLQIVPDRKTQSEGNKQLMDILKMRDKDMTIVMPTPVVIKSNRGELIEELGTKNV